MCKAVRHTAKGSFYQLLKQGDNLGNQQILPLINLYVTTCFSFKMFDLFCKLNFKIHSQVTGCNATKMWTMWCMIVGQQGPITEHYTNTLCDIQLHRDCRCTQLYKYLDTGQMLF